MYQDFTPKFAKRYSNIGERMTEAFKAYSKEVKSGVFPSEEHGFKIDDEVIETIKELKL